MKITLSRIFETSKALATEPGQQLQDFINFTAEMSEQVLRALRNGLTFEDNIRCLTPRISLLHNVEQVVNTSGKTAKRVMATRSYSTLYGIDSFLWYLNNDNQLVVKVGFTSSPSVKIDVDLLIFYD